MVRRGPDGSVVFQGGPDGPVEVWSPEELVMEARLRPRLGDDGATPDRGATAAAAAETARKVKGRWTTYLAFRKSSLGARFGIAPRPRPGLSQPISKRGEKSVSPAGEPPRGLGQAARGPWLNLNDRFSRLTPEERVQRVRERQQAGGRLELKQK